MSRTDFAIMCRVRFHRRLTAAKAFRHSAATRFPPSLRASGESKFHARNRYTGIDISVDRRPAMRAINPTAPKSNPKATDIPRLTAKFTVSRRPARLRSDRDRTAINVSNVVETRARRRANVSMISRNLLSDTETTTRCPRQPFRSSTTWRPRMTTPINAVIMIHRV